VPGPLGIFKSATDAFAFTPIFPGHVGCLAWTRQGVYVCASQHFDKFELGFSPEANFTADAGCVTPLLRLSEVKGPLACPAGTSGTACVVNWQAVCGVIGACADAGTSVRGCAGHDVPAGDDAGAVVDAGTDGRASPPAVPASDVANCGCRVGARGHGVGGSAGALLFAMASWVRRRHARSRAGTFISLRRRAH
jgi:hypothetical protein